ncbi:RNI-like protein [Suillus brevipes Sb2]|nr:RNI-like protein [Suillus brevipes Sb2]
MTATKTILDIRGKQLKLETAADVAPFTTGVDPTTLTAIYLGGNSIGVEAAKEFGRFLETADVLQLADLGDIFTGRTIEEIPAAIKALLDPLSHKTSLREINLNDNAFGERVVPFLTPFLETNHSIRVLRLNNNGLGPAGGKKIAEAVCKSAPTDGSRSNLEVVICGRNRLEDPGAAAWAKAFEAHKTLIEVQMPQNGIRMDGAEALGQGLVACSELQIVNFQDNAFIDVEMDEEGRKAVRAWGEAVKTSWPKLRFLDLSDCMLSNGEGEVPPLLEAFNDPNTKNLQNLQELRLQNNNLDAKSYEVLAQAVTKLTKLKRLDLQDNDDVEDNEHLDDIAEHLKAHGGKLIRTEEDEEEEEDVEENVEESPEEVEAAAEISAPLATEKSTFQKAADTLANLMSKVHVG